MSKTSINELFLITPGWAVEELGLTGVDLTIYSLIYGYSQAEKGCFYGSLSDIQKWTQKSKQTNISSLKRLTERGLLIRNEIVSPNGQRRVEYTAVSREKAIENMRAASNNELEACKNDGQIIRPGVKKLDHPGQIIRPPRSNNLTTPVKNLDPNNKYNNKYNNIRDYQSINQSDDVLDQSDDVLDRSNDGLIDGIKAQIEYDTLSDEYDSGMLDAVVQIIAEVRTTTKSNVRIGSEDKPAAIVQSVFSKLSAIDVSQTLDALLAYAASNKIANAKALLTMFLYNAHFGSAGDICRGRYDTFSGAGDE